MYTVTALVGQPFNPELKKAKQATPKSEMAGAEVKKYRDQFARWGLRFAENKGQVTDFGLTKVLGRFTGNPPISFQKDGKEVNSSLWLHGNSLVFAPENFQVNEILTTSPGVEWGTYYGGNGVKDFVSSVATDRFGNVFLVGTTFNNSEIAPGGHQSASGGDGDAFLVKFNSQGQRIWATYYGGTALDSGYAVATDTFGNIFVAGITYSESGISNNGHQANKGGGADAFLVKFNSDGQREWASYYGGEGQDNARSIATTLSGDVLIAGRSSSNNNIAITGHQNAFLGGSCDAFVAKFSSNGIRQWGTYYGGFNTDYANSVSVDISGNVFLAGTTYSTNGIAFNGFRNGLTNKGDAFLAKFNSSGNLQWGTYYGGSKMDEGRAVASDRKGNVFLAGSTQSNNGQIGTSGGYKEKLFFEDTTDGFLVKFNGNGIRQWATNYGGDSTDFCTGVTTDTSGNVFVTGLTRSMSITGTAIKLRSQNLTRNMDAFVVKFTNNGQVVYQTTYGDAGEESGQAIATDLSGNIYFAGNTIDDSNSFGKGIAVNGFKGVVNQADHEAFLVKIADNCPLAWYKDIDGDGYSDTTWKIIACERPTGYKLSSELIDFSMLDCNDYAPEKNPASPEICNNKDDNCNGEIDEGFDKYTYFEDKDGDGYANFFNGLSIVSCDQPEGYTVDSLIIGYGDCNDNSAGVIPGSKIRFYKDEDGDGYSDGIFYESDSCFIGFPFITSSFLKGIEVDCNDNDQTVSPGALEFCSDGIDNNCNGVIDEIVNHTWFKDFDNDGYRSSKSIIACSRPTGYKLLVEFYTTGIDCDDTRAYVNPGAKEVCGNGRDEDCNGLIDEVSPTVWYKDADGDKYTSGAMVVQCKRPAGYISEEEVSSVSLLDCNDSNPKINPDIEEIAGNKKDDDCNGQIDENCQYQTVYKDLDGDGFGVASFAVIRCGVPPGFSLYEGDCGPNDPTVYPGATEIGDGKDNDCNGLIDEGLPCLKTWYWDFDGDGYGRNSKTKLSCEKPAGYAALGGDCDDLKDYVYPGSTIGRNCGVTNTVVIVRSFSANILDTEALSDKLVANALPNPHDGSFIIEVQSPVAGKGSIVLYDLQGRTITTREEQLQKGNNRVQFSNMKKMNYMYRVMVNGKSAGGKVLSVN